MQAQFTRIPSPWIFFWAFICALGWLVPPVGFTHWFEFYSDAWIAYSFLIAAIALLWTYGDRPWPMPFAVGALAAISLIPIAQWATGLIALGGHAWLCSLFLLAFALTVWCSFTWEKAAPAQCLDALFAALLIAAIATVGLQVKQWVSWENLDAWWVIGAEPTRPNGNLGQANLAATLLCWGLCAAAWFTVRRRLPWLLATALAAILLFGIALSSSRTAFLGLLISIALVFWYRKLWNDKRVVWVIAGLALYFLVCVFLIQWINETALSSRVLSASSMSARFQIWSIAIEAIREKPWFGYGWGQSYAAQLTVADRMPPFHQAFNSAHNLVLDVILWNGIPLATLLLGGMGLWLFRRLSSIDRPETFILGLCIVVIANHSMLEYPLHYAFFLLPLGWFIGAFEARFASTTRPCLNAPRTLLVAAVFLMAAFLAQIHIEYLMINDAFRIQTLRGLHQSTELWREPKARILGHLVSQMKLEQMDIYQNKITQDELQKLEDVAFFAHSPSTLVMVAGAFAMNGQPEKAQWWLRRICSTNEIANCRKMQSNWQAASEKHPEIAAIAWPETAVGIEPN